MSVIVCMVLASALHCQDIALSGVPRTTSFPSGEGARLCFTTQNHSDCRDISREFGSQLIQQHECAAARLDAKNKFVRPDQAATQILPRFDTRSGKFYELKAPNDPSYEKSVRERIAKWCTERTGESAR